jgi:hypothetical protein
MEVLISLVKTFTVGSYKTARQFLQLLGLMSSCLQVVREARLFIRPIQVYLMAFWSIRDSTLEQKILVRSTLLPHLLWWRSSKNLQQGVFLNSPETQCTVTTDASLVGWGGHMGEHVVQGLWSQADRLLHINVLEMKAVFLSLEALVSHLIGKVVLIRTDNTTVMSYINKKGGTKAPGLCILTYQMWTWCLKRGISLKAIHIPGTENVLADKLSRVFVDPTSWEIHPRMVNLVFQVLGRPMMDLFASTGNQKLPCFCSRYPEAEAYHTNALDLNWRRVWGYAYPPLALLPMVIQKIRQDGATIILLAPFWPKRSYYPDLLDLLIDFPCYLQPFPEMLSQDRRKLVHPDPKVFSLVAWKLSGVPSLRQEFLQVLQKPSSRPELNPLLKDMKLAGEISVPGVRNMVSVPVRLLSLK